MRTYKVDRATLSDAFCRDVYTLVQQIPVGTVTTYGDIARLLGLPHYSRLVGRALKQVPTTLSLPCHRVVNAQGALVPHWAEQRMLLQAEGICFKPSGNVSLQQHRWAYEATCPVTSE